VFFRPILRLYTKIYTQSKIDNERFIELGNLPENTEIMKNLKFDIEKVDSDIDLLKGENKVLIAGSTHSGENEIVIKTYSELRGKYNGLKLIIAPRHLERIADIEKILKNTDFKVGYRSKGDNFEDKDIILLDTLGELKKTYAICDIAFIGGSFNKTGGHNPLEATVYNVPTITGPSIKNFRDIYGILTRAGASILVKNQREFYDCVENLLSDESVYKRAVESCQNIFDSQKGALEFVLEKIKVFTTME
jgi:3-deoxy-D-manno-octulosonic-acid transferase